MDLQRTSVFEIKPESEVRDRGRSERVAHNKDGPSRLRDAAGFAFDFHDGVQAEGGRAHTVRSAPCDLSGPFGDLQGSEDAYGCASFRA